MLPAMQYEIACISRGLRSLFKLRFFRMFLKEFFRKMSNLRQKHLQVKQLGDKPTPVSLESLESKLDKVIELLTIISEREQIIPQQIVVTSDDLSKGNTNNIETENVFIPQINTEGMNTSAKSLETGIKSRDISGNLKRLKELQSGEE